MNISKRTKIVPTRGGVMVKEVFFICWDCRAEFDTQEFESGHTCA